MSAEPSHSYSKHTDADLGVDQIPHRTVGTVDPNGCDPLEVQENVANRAPGEGLESRPFPTVATVGSAPEPAVDTVDLPIDSSRDTAPVDPRERYLPGGDWHYAETIKGRIFRVVSNLVHPDTGASLISLDRVKAVVSRSSVYRYAWVVHDKDRYTKVETETNPRAIPGKLKPRHVEIVIEYRNQTSVGTVARSFTLPPNQIEVKKGRGAFLDCCEYLTHEREDQHALGKYRYPDAEIQANFSFREMVDAHAASRTKQSGDGAVKMTAVDRLAMAIQNDGLTLSDAEQLDPLSFNRGELRLKRARSTYLAKQPQPPMRINIYLYGEGGTGKDALARALARQLIPGDWIPGVKEPFFVLGGDNVAWEGYDGELIVIIEEARAGSLIKAFGRKELFAFLNPFPARQKLNIKNASVLPVNVITIMTGPDDFETFLDGLAGEYTDKSGTQFTAENKNQSYRRIPMILPVRDDEFDIMVNKGFVDNTNEYREYYTYNGVRQNMRQVLTRVKGIQDPTLRSMTQLAIEAKQVAPIIEQHQRIVSSASSEREDPDALVAEFSSLGEFVSDEERAASRADALTRARAQADGVTADFLAAGVTSRAWVSERTGLPPVIYTDNNPDMSLWDAATETYNGQPPLPLSTISPEFKSTD